MAVGQSQQYTVQYAVSHAADGQPRMWLFRKTAAKTKTRTFSYFGVSHHRVLPLLGRHYSIHGDALGIINSLTID